ncbi:Pre-mRNA-processing protein 40A [Hondaea fermentalgiana]|uniref:Pre-mRNA-processing protein 40A n=1 Tax=Hondaea fermentalgiana TaxID=2315210 RepID=A0A2R5GPU4_9STRA|nr:Pre-mRNA-processing protein 40A [Hondaea fermentalgiana]|eukprot:GBG32887.1 Pre-mRNA-processing protein 40A [Hondaea fermentalgiana]
MEPPCDVKKKLSCDTTEMSAPPCKDSIVENSIDHVSNEHSFDMDDADDFVDDDSTVDESNKNIESDEPATPAVEPSSASSEDVSRERELSSSDTDPEKSGASERLEMLEKADEKAKDSATDSPTDDVERETSPEAENMLDHTVEEFRMHDSASENSRDAECSPNDTDSSVKKAEDETSKNIVVEVRESTPASHQDKNGCTFKTEAITGLQSKESMITKNAKDTNDEEEEEEEKEKEAELKEDESAGNTRWLEIKDSKTGRMYYYNESTKKSVWKKPADFDRQSVLLAMEERRKGEVDWVEAVDEFGRVYYFDQNTMAARWDRPASLSLPEVATQLKQEKDSLAPVDTKTKVPARKEVLSPTYIARSFGSRARSATSNFHSRVGHICGTNDGNIVEQPHK